MTSLRKVWPYLKTLLKVFGVGWITASTACSVCVLAEYPQAYTAFMAVGIVGIGFFICFVDLFPEEAPHNAQEES